MVILILCYVLCWLLDGLCPRKKASRSTVSVSHSESVSLSVSLLQCNTAMQHCYSFRPGSPVPSLKVQLRDPVTWMILLCTIVPTNCCGLSMDNSGTSTSRPVCHTHHTQSHSLCLFKILRAKSKISFLLSYDYRPTSFKICSFH